VRDAAGLAEPDAASGFGRTDGGAVPGVSYAGIDSADRSPIRPMIALGQFRDTFIIAVDDEGIAIVDQHVAHERVLFERITERLRSGRLESHALLRREECETTIRALAEDLDGLDRGSRVDEAVNRLAATMACHAAVKANYPLTGEKMAHILDELRRTAYSTICPHGRPVMLRLTRREVEKNFQRI
jgi:DNA mismatch repair protein MutL